MTEQTKEPAAPKKSSAGKKTLMIIGGIVVAIVVILVVVFVVVFSTSKKLVCESPEGDITIMYNDDKLTGYVANGITYDLDQQQKVAERIGVSAYLDDFSGWFSANTSGICKE